MNMLRTIIGGLFGNGRNVVAETVGVFRPNAELSAARAATHRAAALGQYAAEFHARENRTWIDALADAINRLVRPVITLALLYPIPATIHDPEAMAKVWAAIATLPPGYWAVVGIVLPFYFGGRMQIKALNAGKWRAAAAAAIAFGEEAAAEVAQNPALDDWRAMRGS